MWDRRRLMAGVREFHSLFSFCLSDSATRLELTSADIAIRLWNVSAESEWEWEVKREMKTKRNLSLNAASRVDTRCRESRAIEKWNLNKLRNTTALTLNLLKLCRESSESKFESQSQWDAGTLLAALGEINEHTRQDSQRPTVRPHGMAWKFNSMRLFFVWSRLSTLFFFHSLHFESIRELWVNKQQYKRVSLTECSILCNNRVNNQPSSTVEKMRWKNGNYAVDGSKSRWNSQLNTSLSR